MPTHEQEDGEYTLDIRGPRGALTQERARELVSAVLNGSRTDFRRLILSTWALSVESAAVLADAVRALPQLESAVLADIIAGRPEAEGLAVYRTLGDALSRVQLREIDLSDNAVGPKGIEACRDFLSNQLQLERLLFCNCGISAEAARSIADLVLFRTPTALKKLHFFNNMSGNGGAIAIADIVRASPDLTDFRVSSSRGGKDGGVALARALRHAASSLRRLDLNDNTFGVTGGVAIGATLRACNALHELNIGDTAIEDAGLHAVASGVVRGSAHTLAILNVSSNELTAHGARAVARLLRRCTQLRELDASENEFGDEGAAYIARAISRRQSFRTDVSATAAASVADGENIDPFEVLRIAEAGLSRRACTALAAAAGKSLPRLTRLDLSRNGLTRRGVAAARAAHVAAGGAADTVHVEEEEDDEDDDDEDGGEASDEGAYCGDGHAVRMCWNLLCCTV